MLSKKSKYTSDFASFIIALEDSISENLFNQFSNICLTWSVKEKKENRNFEKTIKPDSLLFYAKLSQTLNKYSVTSFLYNLADTLYPTVLKSNQYFDWGYCCEKIRKHREAIKIYSKIIKKGRNKDRAYYYSGLNNMKIGQYQEAIENFQIVYRLNSNPSYKCDLDKNWGRTLQDLNQFDLALAKYQEVIKCYDEPSTISRFLVWCAECLVGIADTISNSAEYKKAYEIAIDTLNKAIDMDSLRNFYAYSLLGYCMNKLGRNKEAEQYYRYALNIIEKRLGYSPNDPDLLGLKANYLLFSKIDAPGYNETIRFCELALKFDSNSVFVLRNMAAAQLLQRKYPDAKKTYSEIFNLVEFRKYSDTRYGWNEKKLLEERVLRDLEYLKKEYRFYSVSKEEIEKLIDTVNQIIKNL